MMSSAVTAAVAFVGMGFFLFQDLQILLVFQQETCGLPQGIGSQLPDPQSIQSRSPVQSLRNRGFLQDGLVVTELMDRQGHLGAEPVIYMGQLGPQNSQFLFISGYWIYR